MERTRIELGYHLYAQKTKSPMIALTLHGNLLLIARYGFGDRYASGFSPRTDLLIDRSGATLTFHRLI